MTLMTRVRFCCCKDVNSFVIFGRTLWLKERDASILLSEYRLRVMCVCKWLKHEEKEKANGNKKR